MSREGSLRVPNVDPNGSPVEALRQSSIAFRVPEGCKALIFGGSILKIDELSVLTNPPKYYHNLPDKQSSIAFGQFQLRHWYSQCTDRAQLHAQVLENINRPEVPNRMYLDDDKTFDNDKYADDDKVFHVVGKEKGKKSAYSSKRYTHASLGRIFRESASAIGEIIICFESV